MHSLAAGFHFVPSFRLTVIGFIPFGSVPSFSVFLIFGVILTLLVLGFGNIAREIKIQNLMIKLSFSVYVYANFEDDNSDEFSLNVFTFERNTILNLLYKNDDFDVFNAFAGNFLDLTLRTENT